MAGTMRHPKTFRINNLRRPSGLETTCGLCGVNRIDRIVILISREMMKARAPQRTKRPVVRRGAGSGTAKSGAR